MSDFFDSPPYVRLAEAVFPVLVTDSAFVLEGQGEWRFAWTEQAFDPFSGTYRDANPARFGTVATNYATELNSSFVESDRLYWCRLKGSVNQQQVYEILGAVSGGRFDVFYTVPAWSTDQHNYKPPDNVSILRISSTTSVFLTGADVQDGRTLTWINPGTQPILIPNESASSTTTNRWEVPGGGTLILGAGDTMTTSYDPTTGRNLVTSTTGTIYREQTATISTSQNNYPLTPNVESVTFNVTTASDLGGLTPGVPGRPVTITNGGTSTLTLINESGSSTTTNRLTLEGGVSRPLLPGMSVSLIYDTITSRWVELMTDLPGRQKTDSISSSQDDYAMPVVFTSLIADVTGSRNLTGMTLGYPGRPVTITNSGSGTLTIKHETTSTAANRFELSGSADVVLATDQSRDFVYDGVDSRWRDVVPPAITSPLTTKGDVWGYGSADARIPIGSNGQVLAADSGETLGLKWADVANSVIIEDPDAATLTATTIHFANTTDIIFVITNDGSGNIRVEASFA